MKNWPESESLLNAFSSGTGEGVKIAVLDSGIEAAHPGLGGLKLEDDWIIEEDNGKVRVSAGQGTDVFGHGTAIASVIQRYAPGALIGSFRVLNASLGSRNYLIREGAMLAMEKGYQILNCSFGCRDDLGRHAMIYKQWLDQAYLKQVHVVTACNNDNVNHQEWPGFFPTCINVNMAITDEVWFRYRRDHLVEFAAAGVGVELPWVNGSTKTLTGSSFATPIVSAFVARLLQTFPSLSVSQAKAVLQAFANEWSNQHAHNNVPRQS